MTELTHYVMSHTIQSHSQFSNIDLNYMLCGMFDLYLFETIQFKFERRAIQNTSFMSATPQRNIL